MAIFTRQAADVRITEYDLSTTININANATAALVVVSSQGPTVPTFYATFDDFTNDFGNPNAQVSFDHYMAMMFFQDGNSMWAVRSVGAGALYASAACWTNNGTLAMGINTLTGTVDPQAPQWASYVTSGQDPL